MARSNPSTTVQAVAAERGLGGFVDGWDSVESQRRGAGVVVWGMLGAGGAAIAALGAANTGASWGWPALIAGLAFIALALAMGVRTARAETATSAQLYCFEGGVVPARAGRPTGAYAFAEAPLTERITRFTDGARERIEIELGFDDPQAGPWRLEGSDAARAEAHDAIAESSGRVRAKSIIAELESGATVDLGAVALTPDGVRLPDGEEVPFGAVTGFDLEAGVWTLEHGEGGSASAPMNDTLDYRAFSAIIRATLAARERRDG